MRYSLKASCEHCGRYGTIDDMTLTCFHCHKLNEISEDQLQQREADKAAQSAALSLRK